MSKGQTYDTYFKEYYHNNKDTIIANSKEYRRKANWDYYEKNRLRLLAKSKMKRLLKRLEKLDKIEAEKKSTRN